MKKTFFLLFFLLFSFAAFAQAPTVSCPPPVDPYVDLISATMAYDILRDDFQIDPGPAAKTVAKSEFMYGTCFTLQQVLLLLPEEIRPKLN